MNVYWCAEHMSFYSNLEKAFLYTSILTWKHFYPNDTTHLYCDTESKQIIEEIGIINLWDNINTEVLNKKQYNLDKKAFWASSKLKVINEIQAPFVLLDLDLYLKQDFIPADYWENDTIGNFMEITTHHYPEPYQIKKYMSLPDMDWDDKAVNVAFLYIKDDNIRKEYAEMALGMMQEMNDKAPMVNGLHMVFCEQKLLWQIIKKYNLNHRYLFNETLYCSKDQWIENGLGLFAKEKQYNYACHLGPGKRLSLDDSDGYHKDHKQYILETFFRLFPHLSQNIANLLNTGHV
jgi:hypothetical protein